MPDYQTASRTKDFFQNQLCTDFPQIVSLAPRLASTSDANKQEAIIVIGVRLLNPAQAERNGESAPQIPDRLPAIDANGNISDTETVPVKVQPEGPVTIEMNTARVRPCPGGYSCSHNIVPSGTLGGVATIHGSGAYILSNNHVLAAGNSCSVGDLTLQPSSFDGTGSGDEIGHLHRWVPVNFVADNEVDAALAEVNSPWSSYVSRTVVDIGTVAAVADATPEQRVRKSGRTTQLTYGKIISTNATVFVSFGARVARFVNQLQYSRMTSGGDSGSLIWDAEQRTVVGLHFAGSSDGAYSYGNKILRVLALLGEKRTVWDQYGNEITFPEVSVALD